MLCPVQISLHIKKVIQYSGRAILRLGQYQSCQQIDTMNYNFIALASPLQPSATIAYIGLCLPKACTKNQLTIFIQNALENNTKLLLKSITNQWIDEYPYTWVFYLTVTLLFLFITCAIYSTLLNIKPKDHFFIGNFNIKQSMKIFKYKSNDLNVFNGVRSLAMLWVILGHTFSLGFQGTLNLINIEVQAQTWFYLFVGAGLFAVDTFFFIGGFLVAYSVLKQNIKSKRAYLLAIFHRMLRFWPAYLMTIMIFYSIFLHTNTGPFWADNEGAINNCQAIWKPLLFVDNLVDNGQSMCLGWGWYIQNDMQIFVYCMLMIFILSKNKVVANIIIWLSIIGSVLFTFFMSQANGYRQLTHMSDFATWATYMTDVYIKPWARWPPYLYGLFLGIAYVEFLNEQKMIVKDQKILNQCYFSKMKNKFKASRLLRIFFEFFGLFLIILVSALPRSLQLDVNAWPQFMHSFYLATGKLFFVVGLSFLIIPSLLGIKSWVLFSMDTNFFNFMAKLSFCTYLVHLIVISWLLGGRKYDYYYTTDSMHVLFWFVTLISLVWGYIMVMTVQVPFAKFTKVFMDKIKESNEKKNNRSSESLKEDAEEYEKNQKLLPKDEIYYNNQILNEEIKLYNINETIAEKQKQDNI